MNYDTVPLFDAFADFRLVRAKAATAFSAS